MTKKIFKSTLLVCAVVFTVGLALVMGILYQYFNRQLIQELEKEAAYLAEGVLENDLDYLSKFGGQEERITLIDTDGSVLYDNKADEVSMGNHKDREEVQEAMEEGSGQSARYSNTLSERTVYYAQRLTDGRILRISSTQYSVISLLYQLIQPILWVLILMLALSGIIAGRISKRIVGPINNLDLEHPDENQIYDEMAPLLGKIQKQKNTIQEQLEQAKKQQQEFSIITENMKEGLVVLDAQTMILSVNSSALKLLHARPVSDGQSVYTLNRSEVFRSTIEKVLEGRHVNTVLNHADKAIRLIANPVVRNTKTEGAVLLMVDVTEKIERENLRREFTANVSHELKTPLTSISGFAEIIQDGFVKEEDVKKFAGRIFKEAQRLITLVEDVIKISQLDEGEIPYESENVDVYQATKETLDRLQKAAKEKDVHMYIEGEGTFLHTARPILEEILLNLCDNGIKYNKQGGTLTVSIQEEVGQVEITVSDTGIGVPEADQSRIFERFYRVDKSHSKKIGGTGLGLSIVKHGVNYLGGKISLESEEGKGTKISLTFPKK